MTWSGRGVVRCGGPWTWRNEQSLLIDQIMPVAAELIAEGAQRESECQPRPTIQRRRTDVPDRARLADEALPDGKEAEPPPDGAGRPRPGERPAGTNSDAAAGRIGPDHRR